jgi:hypothetical protein
MSCKCGAFRAALIHREFPNRRGFRLIIDLPRGTATNKEKLATLPAVFNRHAYFHSHAVTANRINRAHPIRDSRRRRHNRLYLLDVCIREARRGLKKFP